jgi:hypothetical protein
LKFNAVTPASAAGQQRHLLDEVKIIAGPPHDEVILVMQPVSPDY